MSRPQSRPHSPGPSRPTTLPPLTSQSDVDERVYDKTDPHDHHEPTGYDHLSAPTVGGLHPAHEPPAQRVPPSFQSRREFSIKGIPLDHANAAVRDADSEHEPIREDDLADVPDHEAAEPSDGFPAPLVYYRMPGKGLYWDIRRVVHNYRTDWTDAFNKDNFSTVVSCILFMFFACIMPALAFGTIFANALQNSYGVMEALLSTAIAGLVCAFFSGQALTIQGMTGPELAYQSMLFGMCQTLGIEYLPAKFWAGLWQSLFTTLYSLLGLCSLIGYVTRYTEEIFGSMITMIEIVAACTNIVNIFLSGVSTGASLYSVIIVALTYNMAVKFRDLRGSDWLNANLRKNLANYGVTITIILLTIVSSFVVPAFGIKDFRFLKVPATITPTYIDPTTGVARAWVVKAAGYEKPFPTWGVFLMIAPALGGTLLGFLDQNLTEVLVNRKDRMFKKPPAYHLTNFICGTVLYPICAILGLPPTHAATVRSLAHVMAVTTTEVVQLPDGGGTTVRVVNVAEQRVTHLAIHVLIWISLAATAALAYVPQPIIIGVFLYLGISSIRGNQMFDRLSVLLTFQRDRWPKYYYVQEVDRREMTRFTLMQTGIVCLLVAISRINEASLAFPFIMASMIPMRIFIVPKLFSKEAIDVLDR